MRRRVFTRPKETKKAKPPIVVEEKKAAEENYVTTDPQIAEKLQKIFPVLDVNFDRANNRKFYTFKASPDEVKPHL